MVLLSSKSQMSWFTPPRYLRNVCLKVTVHFPPSSEPSEQVPQVGRPHLAGLHIQLWARLARQYRIHVRYIFSSGNVWSWVPSQHGHESSWNYDSELDLEAEGPRPTKQVLLRSSSLAVCRICGCGKTELFH